MKFNFKDNDKSNDGNFSALPEGRYLVQVDDVNNTTTKNGDPMLVVKYKVTQDKYKNRVVFDNIVLKESTQWKLLSLLKGIKSPLVRENDVEQEVIVKELKGKNLCIYLEETEYNGKESNKVTRYITLDDAQDDPTPTLKPKSKSLLS